MVIEKVLNNNVVVIKEQGKEKIVMGRGLAFKKRPGDPVEEEKIDKVFTLSSQENTHRLMELMQDIPLEHILLGDAIITHAKTTLGKPLNEMIYLTLTDHLHMAITRFLQGIEIRNPMLYDIRRFYPDEFQTGLWALEKIKEDLGIELPEDEAGFIAFHIANAEQDDTSIQKMFEITRVMQEVMNIVKYRFHVVFDEESIYYYRFISHLRFFAQRLVNKTPFDEHSDEELLAVVSRKYKDAYECVENIAEFLQNKYDYRISDEEKLYLTIHIERAVYKAHK